MKKIKKVVLMLRPGDISEFKTFLLTFTSWLIKRKIQVSFLDNDAPRILPLLNTYSSCVKFCSHEEAYQKKDLILSLGGDGTLLGVARNCTSRSPPVLGINLGSLGFMTEFSRAEIFEELSSVLKGNYSFNKIYAHSVSVLEKEQVIFNAFFINDVVIHKQDIARLFHLDVEVEKTLVSSFSGDGLIVSTPVGSTAYSLSAGGPIVHPMVEGIIITPICPHALGNRPLVIPNKLSIQLHPYIERSSVLLTIDGQESFPLTKGRWANVFLNKKRYCKLIINPQKNYFSTLKDKFTFGRR